MTRVKIIYFARFSRELNLKRRITKLEIEWTREGDTYYNDNVYRKRYLTHIFLQYPATHIYSWQKGLWKVSQNAFNENTHQKKKKKTYKINRKKEK